jgi:hypothetical protein
MGQLKGVFLPTDRVHLALIRTDVVQCLPNPANKMALRRLSMPISCFHLFFQLFITHTTVRMSSSDNESGDN